MFSLAHQLARAEAGRPARRVSAVVTLSSAKTAMQLAGATKAPWSLGSVLCSSA